MCLHRLSGQAVVRVNGKDIYLGPYGSADATEKYEAILADLIRHKSVPLTTAGQITITDLMAAFMVYAATCYRHPDGSPTSEVKAFALSLRHLRRLYASTVVTDFSPHKLKNVRQCMLGDGWSRPQINQRIGRIKRVFKWGLSEELLPASVYTALASLSNLKRGR